MKGYGYLSISIAGEVFGTAMLKLSNGFTVLGPSLGVAAGYGLAFYFLALCLRTIPLSLAYAIWSGAGTALTALIGYVFWNEAFGVLKLLGIVLIIGGIMVLNASDMPKKEKPAAELK
jgi:multidrug resistance protein EbrB